MVKKSKKTTKKELAREIAALKAEVASLKAEAALKTEVVGLRTEFARFRTEERVKLKADIDSLHRKMHAELEELKAGTGVKRQEKKIRGGVKALEAKAAKAKHEAKAAIEARVTNIRNEPKKLGTGVEQPQPNKPSN